MSLLSKIESILFVSSEPVSLTRLQKSCGAKKQEIRKGLEDLRSKYSAEKKSGIVFIEAADKYQLVSHPDNAEIVKEFLKSDTSGELTDPALETLTIIAYRGPVTKPELEQIRGVNCSLILRNLLIRGLIEREENKKTDLPRYRVTNEFVKFLGVSNVNELPEYEKLSNHETLEEVLKSTDDTFDKAGGRESQNEEARENII